MSTIRAIDRQFANGLRLVPSVERAETPVATFTNIAPTELATVSELEQLFDLRDLNQRILESLRPVISNGDLLRPALFFAGLQAVPENLRFAASLLPDAAPSFGRAALLISNLIRLVEQGLSYQAAIIEA